LISETFGVVLVVAVVLAACCVVAAVRIPTSLKLLICVALALRIGGAVARYLVLNVGYRGIGDAVSYYEIGLSYAERYWSFDFSPLYDPSLRRGGRWWSTEFVPFPASFVTALIGPTMLGSFMVFSLFAFAGLTAFAVAFRRWYPGARLSSYARWVWLFPSLWYWPSSIGKEALALLGIGLTVAGLFGPRRRMSVVPLVTGFALLSTVRPELAGVVAVSVLLSEWLSFEGRWTPGRLMQAAIVGAVAILVVRTAMSRVGLESLNVGEVQSFIEGDPARQLGGGSSIDAVSVGASGLIMAPVNVLLRPFPWEAQNAFAMVSAAEISFLWLFVWRRRRRLAGSIRSWRRDRLMRLSLVFIAVYSVAIGMMLSNLGTIARQRIFIFPFLFLLLEAPALQRARARPAAGGHMPAPRRRVRRPLGAVS
jgi:hypothetical protein